MTTALPPACGGCGLGVVFIDTEATFSATRLVEMAKARHSSHFSSPHTVSQLAARVRVHRTLTSAELERLLVSLEEELAEMGVGLVVVDSVAGPVRREYGARDGREMAERAATLGGFTSRLKYLAEVFHVPVVVTNQVTAVGGVSHDVEKESDWSGGSGGGHVTAALGNTWAHCVNIRLLLNHLTESQRTLTVEKSPVSPNKIFTVQINEGGVVIDSSKLLKL
ncbi:DNA repair protein RAD51 homolog 2 [Geodia barretti]|uniref:DNA repair protein RAD51 homolog 2 n=2 Tax=Geodia barretti TaxID=519541 RepID=A0AA35TJ00_GEOBA|nr:DNA repair protein RAD51 homolog 2 [Geodia barretti]